MLACALGMATKEVTVTAPLVVLLYDRTFLAGSFEEAWRRRWKLYLALAATWGIVAALLISTGFHAGTTGFVVKKFTCWRYLLTQAGVIVHYLRLVFWPTGLCLDYGWPPAQTVGEIVLPGMLVVSLLGLTVWALVKRPAWGFLGACFFMILALTSSFVPLNDAAFEHRMYLSLAAVVAGVVIGGWLVGQRLVERGTIRPLAWQATSSAAVIFAGAALAILTFQRNADYHSEISIWRDTEAKAPGNARAYYCLGIALNNRGRIDEAIAQYEKSIELDPGFPEIETSLGVALANHGQLAEAIAHFRKALEISPVYPMAHNYLGTILASRGRLDEAMAHYRKALEVKPDYAEAHNNLGNALAGRGQFDEAIAEYRKVLELDPNNAKAHGNLGVALAGRGQLDEAIAEYRDALKINPNDANAHGILGLALKQRGQLDEAIAEYQKVLELNPNDARAYNNIAWIRATHPDPRLRNAAQAVGWPCAPSNWPRTT